MIRFLSRFTVLFPGFYFIFLGWLTFHSFGHPLWVIFAIFHCYMSPLLVFRFFHVFMKLPNGRVDLNPKVIDGILWLVSYRVQLVHELFHFPEQFLRVIPGAYSLWLSAWGSKMGKNILWAPNIHLYDRASLHFGSDIIVGSGVTISCHAVDRVEGRTVLYYKPIQVGDRVFIGANCVLGPGVVIPNDKKLKFGTMIYQNRTVDLDEMDVTLAKIKSKYLSL